MTTPAFVPPKRTTTAPASAAPPFARGSAAAFLSRASDAARSTSPAPGTQQQAAAPPRDSSPPPEATSDRVSPPNSSPLPPRPTMAEEAAAAGPPLPQGVYSLEQMLEIRRVSHPVPSSTFRTWLQAAQLGEAAVPDGFLGRDSLFAEVNTKKRVMDRRLPNQVLGILAKLTPENYEKLKSELLALPIRQSSDEQVIEVVDTMYNKAVRPEDAPFVELYAKLMADLVLSCDVNTVGKSIRKAIIDKCQKQFEQPFKLEPQDEVDEQGNPLPEALIEEKKKQLKDRLRANIKFLGHLFICGMVKEPVVNIVLYQLLYGKDTSRENSKRRRPDEFELEMFCDLIKKVIMKLSEKVTSQYIPGYLNTVKELVDRKHVHSQRIHFMLQDLLELSANNWQPRRRGTGPMTIKELEEHQQKEREREEQLLQQQTRRGLGGGGSIRTPLPAAAASHAPHQQKFEIAEFSGIVERFIESNQPGELEAYWKALSLHQRTDALTSWLYRLSTVGKLKTERTNVGAVLKALANSSLVSSESAHRSMTMVSQKMVDSDEFDDQPKAFSNWAELVSASHLSAELHTVFLRQILNMKKLRSRVGLVRRCITQIQAAMTVEPIKPSSNPEYVRRFRLLPTILGKQFDDSLKGEDNEEDKDAADAEEEDENGGADSELSVDLLDAVTSSTLDVGEPPVDDVELDLFNKLCTENWSAAETAQHCKAAMSSREVMTNLKIVSTLFTYLRLEDADGREYERLKDALGLFFKREAKAAESNLLYLTEAYCTFRELGRVPEHAFKTFVTMLNKFMFLPRDFWASSAQRHLVAAMKTHFGLRLTAPDAVEEVKALEELKI